MFHPPVEYPVEYILGIKTCLWILITRYYLGCWSYLNLHGHATALHQRGQLHSVTKHRVVRDLGAHHSPHHLPTVHPHPQLQSVLRLVLDLKGENLGQEIQSHLGELHSMMKSIGNRYSRSNHVRITNRFNLQSSYSVSLCFLFLPTLYTSKLSILSSNI